MTVRNWKMALTISNSSMDLETTEATTSQTFLLTFAKVLKGDKGDKGDTGNKGETGAKGDTGATGPQGEKGDTVYLDMTASINSDGHLILTTNDYNDIDATINAEGHLILTL